MSEPSLILSWQAAGVGCTIIGGVIVWSVWSLKATIKIAIAEAVDKITAKMEHDYVPVRLCHERHCAIEKRIGALEGR